MYPEFTLGGTIYYIDKIVPIVAIILFIVVLYIITKSQKLRFREIDHKIPFIIIGTIIAGNYAHFIFMSGRYIPIGWSEFSLLFGLSVKTLDFVGILIGLLLMTYLVVRTMPTKSQNQRWYVMIQTYLIVIAPLGILYLLGDSVIGKANDGFFSIGSFSTNSLINQWGTGAYPLGLLISALSSVAAGLCYYLHKSKSKAHYRVAAGFLIAYVVVLHYQHYTRHLVMTIGGFQMDLRSYCCLLVACILGYFGYTGKSITRLMIPHENTIGETR